MFEPRSRRWTDRRCGEARRSRPASRPTRRTDLGIESAQRRSVKLLLRIERERRANGRAPARLAPDRCAAPAPSRGECGCSPCSWRSRRSTKAATTSPKGVDRAKHRREGLLDHLLGVGVVPQPQIGKVVDALVVTVVEDGEIRFARTPNPFDQFFITACCRAARSSTRDNADLLALALPRMDAEAFLPLYVAAGAFGGSASEEFHEIAPRGRGGRGRLPARRSGPEEPRRGRERRRRSRGASGRDSP